VGGQLEKSFNPGPNPGEGSVELYDGVNYTNIQYANVDSLIDLLVSANDDSGRR
jgi:hypothetical protein